MKITKTGMFSIIGRPNVGKSTLLNALTGEKIAIVSNKPQTTRTRICGIVNRDGKQYVFLDTPGFHKPRTRLGDYMVNVVEESVNNTDAAILVVEPQLHGKQEEILLDNLKASHMPVILLINKIDTIEKEKLLEVIADYSVLCSFQAVIPISAKLGDGIQLLLEELDGLMSEGDALFPEDMVSDQPEKIIAAEYIREKALLLLEREIPHGIAVEIETFRERDSGTLEIGAVIYCEKNSHKGIIIGKQGAMLKEIGTLARKDLESFFETKVLLTLWVKVKEGWRNNQYLMRNFGYEA